VAAERVAVLGIGHMGSAMARRLAQQGFELVLYNRTAARAEELAAEIGASVAASAAEAARDCDILITMVADDAVLTDICSGPDGILAGVRPGSVTIQTSTVMPETVRRLERDFRAAGAGFLDAPVSGSVTTAAAGELAFMVGGDPAHLERARPVIDALSRKVFHLGPVGSGAAVKLAVNAVIMALDVAVSEALVLAEAEGVDRAAAYDVFAGGAAGAPFLQYKRSAFLEPASAPVAFSFRLAEKDLTLITALATRTGVPVAQAEANLAAIRSAAIALGDERDFSEVATHLRSKQAEQ
jgi:3-hydroxyisobutyrate dehydrogenase-like beta-hydroxyacid dehydrogenase